MAAKTGSRDEAFDLAKGVGILAVIGLHLSNRSARLFHTEYSKTWWALKWANLFFNFCVPLFLFVSAVLLARSVARQERPQWGRFAWRRVKAVLFPLVLWSLIYWGLKLLIQDPRVSAPEYWADPGARLFDLAFGKAEFHLYFLSVLAQLCVLFPLLVAVLRPRWLNFWLALIIAITVQTGVVFLQKAAPFRYPASTVFWYMSTVIPGVWLGLRWGDWPKLRAVAWPVGFVMAVAGFGFLAAESYKRLLKQAADGNVVNGSTWAYALGMSLLVISALTLWTASRPGRSLSRVLLAGLGAMSLQLYLMHPIVMELLTWNRRYFEDLPFPSLWFFLATLAGTFAIAWILDKVPYVNTLLFGRDLPPRASRPAEQPVEPPVAPS